MFGGMTRLLQLLIEGLAAPGVCSLTLRFERVSLSPLLVHFIPNGQLRLLPLVYAIGFLRRFSEEMEVPGPGLRVDWGVELPDALEGRLTVTILTPEVTCHRRDFPSH